MAAASHDTFFGHCACGGSTYVSRFDATTNTRLVSVDTTALGARISVRFGERSGADVVIGGSGSDATTTNVLLPLNAETLELRSQRSILSTVWTVDIASYDDKLYALTETGAVVHVGADGTAAKTYDIPALRGLTARGIASSGGKLYALVERSLQGSGLLELTLK
ncbi:MAG: hypothetical protein KF850_11680 [Labilithrix sp.]|nr:hypothetical protein [Labilithrix sp.]